MAKGNPKRIEEVQALANLLKVPGGRRWIWGILEGCHIWQSSMTNNAMRTAFMEGERNVGLWLLAEIQEANPDMFMQMMKENPRERRGSNYASGRDYDPTGIDTDIGGGFSGIGGDGTREPGDINDPDIDPGGISVGD